MANTIRARYSCVSVPREYGEREHWQATVENDGRANGPRFIVRITRWAFDVPERTCGDRVIPAHIHAPANPLTWVMTGSPFTRREACRRAYNAVRIFAGGMFPEERILCEHF